jgi:retron-type reverse transcriptase
MIILDRISESYNNTIEQNQFGFRKNKGCDNAIFILRNVINTSKEKMYICFIDLTAAYDKIQRNLLFRVLDIRLSCTHFISLLKAVYTETTASITGLRKTFPTKAGCRQGGIESPILFNIYFDTVCRVLDTELRAELGDDYGIIQIPHSK